MDITYAHGDIADKHYPVKEARIGINGETFGIGDIWHGQPIQSIVFYTGFAGCPPRYYIARESGTTIAFP